MWDKAFYLNRMLPQVYVYFLLQYFLEMIPPLIYPLLNAMHLSRYRTTVVIKTEKEGPDPPAHTVKCVCLGATSTWENHRTRG